MYRGVIYVPAARTRWQGKLHPGDVIASVEAPWRWLARVQLLQLFNRLDPNKCGYALLEGEQVLEQYDPEIEESRVEAA